MEWTKSTVYQHLLKVLAYLPNGYMMFTWILQGQHFVADMQSKVTNNDKASTSEFPYQHLYHKFSICLATVTTYY